MPKTKSTGTPFINLYVGLEVLLLAALTMPACSNAAPESVSIDEIDSAEITEQESDSTGTIFDGSAGSARPEGAVSGLLGAINSGDVLGALAHIDPAERDLIADLYFSAIEASEQVWPHFAGEGAIADLEVEVLALSELRTTQHSEHLAWVETDEVELFMAAPTEVAAAFFSTHGPWESDERDDVAVRFDEYPVDALISTFDWMLPGLAVTKLEGRWYVSFARTILEIVRFHAHQYDADSFEPNSSERTPLESKVSSTPELAVLDLFSAVSDDRMRNATEHLVAAEAQAFADYPAIVDSWLSDTFAIEGDLDPESVSVYSEDDGRAIVEVSEFAFTASGSDRYIVSGFNTDFVLADGCLSANEMILRCEPSMNLASGFTSIYADSGWNGLRFVVVQSDGGWSVSIYETLGLYGLPLVNNPVFGLFYLDTVSPWNGPIWPVISNEVAKTLPAQDDGALVLESFDLHHSLIARIAPSEQTRVLEIGPSNLNNDCIIMIWNTDMVAADWGEEPEYFDSADCEDYSARPLEIPAGVEISLTVLSATGELPEITAELR